MIKREITETVYEYDKEGKLMKKTVVETKEEETDTIFQSSPKPINPTPYITWCNDLNTTATYAETALSSTVGANDRVYSACCSTDSNCVDAIKVSNDKINGTCDETVSYTLTATI